MAGGGPALLLNDIRYGWSMTLNLSEWHLVEQHRPVAPKLCSSHTGQ